MSSPPLSTVHSEALALTPAALAHLKKMLARHGGGKGVHLSLRNTGCSGKSYHLAIIQELTETPYVYPLEEGLVLTVNPEDYPLVSGTLIDYGRKGLHQQFIFHNPHEKASCGCGESFNV